MAESAWKKSPNHTSNFTVSMVRSMASISVTIRKINCPYHATKGDVKYMRHREYQNRLEKFW